MSVHRPFRRPSEFTRKSLEVKTLPKHPMGRDMNPNPSSPSDSPTLGAQDDGLENLEGRLWDRARRNLRLLYNGGGLPASAGPNPSSVVGPLAVVNSKL